MNRLRTRLFLFIVPTFWVCTGCTHLNPSVPVDRPGDCDAVFRDEIVALEQALIELTPSSNHGEAHRVAATAVTYCAHLANRYGLVRPPILHNVMVRLNLKQRGLCYHWTEDLLRRLRELRLSSYRLYWGVAHRGSELREHNSVVIAATGKSFEDGILLDPWRRSGKLYWVQVVRDKYPWRELPPEEQ